MRRIAYQSAVEGTMNIIRQAAAAGVKRLVITGSVSSMFQNDMSERFYRDIVITHEDWNTATVEEAVSGKHDHEPYWIYWASKTAADRAVWEFASEHPEIDITTSGYLHRG